MSRLVLFAALAALVSAPAWAQSKNAEAPAKAEAIAAPKAEAIKPVVRRLTAKSYQDARECLKQPNNEAIIVCAEKFL